MKTPFLQIPQIGENIKDALSRLFLVRFWALLEPGALARLEACLGRKGRTCTTNSHYNDQYIQYLDSDVQFADVQIGLPINGRVWVTILTIPGFLVERTLQVRSSNHEANHGHLPTTSKPKVGRMCPAQTSLPKRSEYKPSLTLKLSSCLLLCLSP